MTSHTDEFHATHDDVPFWKRPASLALLTAALVGGFYILREHWGHVAGFWPYLLLLACPLMHLLHGHGGHGEHGHRQPESTRGQLETARIYTCPMHPEVRQDHPGNCPKCGMTLEPVLPEL